MKMVWGEATRVLGMKRLGYIQDKDMLVECRWFVFKNINKINDPDFLKELLPSETHTGYETKILIDGFQHFPICRPISSNSRYYGGLA